MQQFVESVNALREAKNAKEFVKREKLAYKALDQLQYDEKCLYAFKQGLYEILNNDTDLASLTFIDEIPDLLASENEAQIKKAKKRLANLLRIAAQRNIPRWETREDLINQMRHTKSASAFQHLIEGEKILGYQMIGLNARFAASRSKQIESDKEFISVFSKRKEYLRKKQIADRLALVINAFVSVCGVGMIAAIAMMTVLPVMGLALSIPVLLALSLAGGYTEGYVYHGYVQKFCRQMMVGFFVGIDREALNRGAEKKAKVDRHSLTKEEKKQILDKTFAQRLTKKIFTVLAFPLSLAAGVGFMTLAFSQLISFLPAALLVGTPALIAFPWVLALLLAPMYAIVMCGMLYKAIKKNIFAQIIEHFKNLYSYKVALAKNPQRSKPMHVFLCCLKTIAVMLIIGITIGATLATAGAWFEGSVNFFAAALKMADMMASKISYAIGAVFVGSTIWLSTEKSLGTASALSDLTWNKVKAAFSKTFSSPKEFFKAAPNFVMWLFHIVGNAAVTQLGAEATSMPRPVAATLELIEEAAVDGKDAVLDQHDDSTLYEKYSYGHRYQVKTHHHGHSHSHDHGQDHPHKHDHQHANIWKSGKAIGSGTKNIALSIAAGLRFYTPLPEPALIKLKSLPRIDRAPRSV